MREMPDELYMNTGPAVGELALCDFCNGTPVVYLFGCRDHNQGAVLLASPEGEQAMVTGEALGDWLACEACAELVRSSLRDALAARSWTLHFERRRTPPIHREQIREVIRQAHDQFWANREPEKDRPLRPGEEIARDGA